MSAESESLERVAQAWKAYVEAARRYEEATMHLALIAAAQEAERQRRWSKERAVEA